LLIDSGNVKLTLISSSISLSTFLFLLLFILASSEKYKVSEDSAFCSDVIDSVSSSKGINSISSNIIDSVFSFCLLFINIKN